MNQNLIEEVVSGVRKDGQGRPTEKGQGMGDRHFEWFANLIDNHMDGIVAHARYQISSGKVKGTNCMIEALREGRLRIP